VWSFELGNECLFELKFDCFLPVYLRHVLVSLGQITDHGVDGGLLVIGEDGGDRSGSTRPIVYVCIQLPCLQLQARQVVPAQGFWLICVGEERNNV